MDISVVLPVYNEERNLRPLFDELKEVMDQNYGDWEAVFVDDGSTDRSLEVLRELAEEEEVKVVELRSNFGQTAALDTGLRHAGGDVVVTMDSDMQNDPADIPRLVDRLESSGCDLVNGWRRDREDPFLKRAFSSIATRMRMAFLGTGLHDYGCTLKAYSRETADELSLDGEMHRYVPPLLQMKGFEVCEIEVNHRERHAGETKYGWRRLPKGFLDMVNVWFRQRYDERPLHFFGGIGIIVASLGAAMFLYALYQKFYLGTGLSETAATLIAVFLVLTGLQVFLTGLLADMMVQNRDAGESSRVQQVTG
ncbi:MAG: glycosyltransferase family 2 protein [Candidatus Nanosalina sp.]